MAREADKKTKQKPPKVYINPLRKYLEDAPYIHECRKAWKPGAYEFNKNILIYDKNAYDKFVPKLEILSRDEHYYFTKHLQNFDTDISRPFFKWIIDAADRTRKGTHHLAYCDEGESPSAQAQWKRELNPDKTERPLPRSYSSSQIDLDMAKERDGYVPKINPSYEIFERVRFPYHINLLAFMTAHNIAWKNFWRHTDLGINVGYINAKFVDDALYGPRKFFIYLTDRDRGVPGKFFTYHFNKEMERKDLKLDVPPDFYQGNAVYFDPTAEEDRRFVPVYIIGKHKRWNYHVLLHLEIGTLIKCDCADAEKCLRILPPQLRSFIRPISVSCRMYNDRMSHESWQEYVEEVRRTGRMYVTGIYKKHIGIGRIKKLPEKTLTKFFCEDIHCLGGCVKDEVDLTDICFIDTKKKGKRSVSSSDIPDIEL